MIKEIIQNWKERNQTFKEMQDNDNMVNKLQERKLGHNERVLNQFYEEERQKSIKDQLHLAKLKRRWEEKKQSREFLSFSNFNDNSILNSKNIFLE